ncbi:DUF6064 family protein [Noviherbaspirillum sp. ST9]|uniref:DUF6064 family protein n=1 Tax=Noviherbaspirillum sp. ST9 TaxID=3401606 RepID=UPI003B589C04
MQIPFTAEQFFAVFHLYNEAVWPAQLFLLALSLVAVVLVCTNHPSAGPTVSAILAFLWTWSATVYHLTFFSRINPLAFGFAGMSLIGAAVFLWYGVILRRLQFEVGNNVRSYAGASLIAFALIVYPVLSWLAGHTFPAMPTFGLPCPTTIYTLGLLAFLKAPAPRAPYIVPVMWSVIGGQAAFLLDVPQDLGLVVAGIVGVWMMARPKTGRSRRGTALPLGGKRY